MKKILSFVLAAVALVFTACSNDETIETSGNGQSNKGMVLVATVSQEGSRAAIEVNAASGTWKFTFDDNDNVVVGNKNINNYYTFTNNGNTFSSTDAKTTASPTTWYAYYPGTDIKLTNQEGTAESAADLYALAGATTTATTGTDGLTISMTPQAAVLRIVKVDNYGPCDIYLKTADGKYVSGLKAKKNDAGYEVETSDTKVSVFYKANEGNADIYYVIVPAGVKISVWNDDRCFKTTKEAGLTAGKYYTLTSGPTKGTATATIDGKTETETKTETIEWVQLWIGGPRIATKNAADKMSWTDALKTGDKFVWGKNWHNPSLDDVKVISKDGAPNTDILDATYEYNNNKHGFRLKGKQPGYTDNTVFLSGHDSSSKDFVQGKFWLTDYEEGWAKTMNFQGQEGLTYIWSSKDATTGTYESRPVLTIKTVKWNEQNIQ